MSFPPSNIDPMANESAETKASTWDWCVGLTCVAFVIIGLDLSLFVSALAQGDGYKPLTFWVDSTAVKAYNLTSDNHLFTTINLGVRANNPSADYFLLKSIVAKVIKGKHQVLAQEMLPGGFPLSSGSDTLVHIEAVGLGHRALKGKVAEEVRADVVAGEGRVNVRMYLYLEKVGSRYDSGLCVTCKNVVVDFSRSMVRAQRVSFK